MDKEEFKECRWVEFDSAGNSQNCPWECDGYPEKADTDEGKKHCELCMKGMQVGAINAILDLLHQRAEKEGWQSD